MGRVNVATCELTAAHARGRFRCRAEELGGRLGARLIGAAVYEMGAGETNWPYHYHHGVEEWMYVVSGAPVLRDPSGERSLSPGALVAFPSGPEGAHTVTGPGRVVIFSAGANGWGEGFVSVYPDSDKISAARGVVFRRADALEAWTPGQRGRPNPDRALTTPRWGGATWAAAVWELAPGESTAPYRYEWSCEEWALVLSGAPTLRHPGGEERLAVHDIVCFPEGPDGARRLSNDGGEPARLLIITTPRGLPMSEFRPDLDTVLVRISDEEGFCFRLRDRIVDYWDGEPGAG